MLWGTFIRPTLFLGVVRAADRVHGARPTSGDGLGSRARGCRVQKGLPQLDELSICLDHGQGVVHGGLEEQLGIGAGLTSCHVASESGLPFILAGVVLPREVEVCNEGRIGPAFLH